MDQIASKYNFMQSCKATKKQITLWPYRLCVILFYQLSIPWWENPLKCYNIIYCQIGLACVKRLTSSGISSWLHVYICAFIWINRRSRSRIRHSSIGWIIRVCIFSISWDSVIVARQLICSQSGCFWSSFISEPVICKTRAGSWMNGNSSTHIR